MGNRIMAQNMVKTKIKMPDGSFQYMSHPDNWTDAQIEAAIPEMLQSHENPTNESQRNPTNHENPTVSEDIVNSLANAPGAIIDVAAALPGQILESAGQIGTHPLRAAENLGAGLLEGLKGGANIPSNIARYMQSRGLGEEDIGTKNLRDLFAKAHIPDTGLEQALLGETQKGDEFLRSIGAFTPYARLGGLTKGLGGLARRGGAAAAYATGQEQDPLQAALMGLGAEGITRGAQKVLRRDNFLPSSPLTNQELREAAQNTKGTETDLGNVIQNPFQKEQFENILPKIPLSGANPAMQRTANEITKRGETILDYLKGNQEVPDIGERLHTALKGAYEETKAAKNEKFKTLNEAAQQEGIRTSRSNLVETAKEKLAEIERDPHRARLIDSKFKNILKGIVNPEEEVEPNQIPIGAASKDILNHLFAKGKNKLQFTENEFKKAFGKASPAKEMSKKEYSLQDTDLLRGDFGELANEAYVKGEGALSNLYKSLKDASTKDIKNAIDEADKPHLNKLRDEAMEFYKKNYTPFKDKEIKKFTLQGGDPDILAASFLRKSKLSDRGNLLGKLTSKLSSEDKDLLAYSYFSNAIKEGQLNPSKLNTLYKDLGKKQKNALLSEGMQSVLKDYSKLVQKNSRPLDLMFNPKTGYAGLSELPWKLITAAATSGIGGGFLGGIPGAIGGALLPGIAARHFVKKLTNPTRREKVIKSIIEQREKGIIPPRNIAPFVNALSQASANQGR